MVGSRNPIFSNIPPVTKNLIIINFIIWFAMLVLGKKIDIDIIALGGLHYFSAPDFNPVQLLTYMFMHSTTDFAHILFNMFALFMFGTTLERVFGSSRFLFYYISCGIGAALIQELVWSWTWEDLFIKRASLVYHVDFTQIKSAMDAGLTTVVEGQFLNSLITVGASGAIYGILLAFGMLFPNRPLYIMFLPVPIKAKWMVIGYGILELLIGISRANDGVAHFAHLGGMIFGFLIIIYWKKRGLFNGIYY